MGKNNHLIQIDSSWHWLDVVDPSAASLKKIGKEYGLHPTSLEDCLDPTHLPKHEKIGNITFLIVRAYDESASHDGDTVQELTRKVAVFIEDGFILTVHRKDQPFLKALRDRWTSGSPDAPKSKATFLADLLSSTIFSYERPIDEATVGFDLLEERIFKPNPPRGVIEDGYYLKRKASVYKRMLRMTSDILPKVQALQDDSGPLRQDLKEGCDNLYFYADELLENLNNLLSLHISISSQRTNEVVRVLTIISIFFMPLNLIAGIYGMNFAHMPELQLQWGYPMALLIMVTLTVAIYLWFKKKGWLSRS